MKPILSVRGVAKRYRLTRSRYATLRESLTRWAHAAMGLCRKKAEESTLWALEDIHFDVEPGEIVGIVGRNGAGKSTLLKILSRVTPPTRGSVDLFGRVGSLLEVGTGFHPELTGRQNVYLNGALLGMSRREIETHFDEIVAFAEVDKFIDEPVKHYSSGMFTRLAFAVAAHLQPEILLVDEVLAVGDAFFQQKCIKKVREFGRQGGTILFVSHNLEAVTSLCTRALYLDRGRLTQDSDPQSVVQAYLSQLLPDPSALCWSGDVGDEFARLKGTSLHGGAKGEAASTDAPLTFQLSVEILRPIYGLICGVEILSAQEKLLAYSAYDDNQSGPPAEVAPGPFHWEVTIPPNTLAAGTYLFRVLLGIANRKVIVHGPGTLQVTLHNSSGVGRRFSSEYYSSIFRPAWTWRRLGLEAKPRSWARQAG